MWAQQLEAKDCTFDYNNDVGAAAGNWVDGGGNVIGGPARLGVLSDNGGPTLSLLPRTGSPAIDAGVPSVVTKDARGLSRQAGAAPDAGAIEAGAQPVADSDADGLPDTWEVFRGMNPNERADAATDADGDGLTALNEFRSGTDPRDPRSVLKIERIQYLERDDEFRYVVLTWQSVPGVTYRVETSTDLQQWRTAPGGFTSYIIPPGMRLLDFYSAVDGPNSFYRLVVDESAFD